MSARTDLDAELRRLKDFQRDTVDYAFAKLFRDQQARRFLVADEVGLGKTMVARGLTALAVDHLRRSGHVDRVDVIYVCSNQDIARQNIRRLNVTGRDEVALASRMTLLPLEAHKLRDNDINLISLTPGTSLDPRSSLGVVAERAVLYWMLKAALGFRRSKKSALRALRGDAGMDSFLGWVDRLDPDYDSERPPIDPGLMDDFSVALRRNTELVKDFEALCDRMSARHEDNAAWGEDLRDHRRQVVGELRSLLAQVCISALEPDLVILDEFQRFRDLLDNRDTPAGELAHQLFNWCDPRTGAPARLLLLSATPYRMYTLAHEQDTDDHQQDFMRTVRFLCAGDEPAANRIADAFAAHKRALVNTGLVDFGEVRASRRQIERELGELMCRTERLAVRDDRDGMLEHRDVSTPLTPSDVRGYLSLQDLARLLEEPDIVEYWKSAPYLLNFMEGYRLKTRLEDSAASLGRGLVTANDDGLPTLPWGAFERYEEIDPGNPRMRTLFADVIESGAWRALWVAPSLPYYGLGGPYADQRVASFTKRLVFSAWNVVPRAVAGMLTYAAERHMLRLLDEEPRNTPQAREQRTQLLTFRISEGRVSSMPVLALLYPSATLARTADPLEYARDAARREEPATGQGLLDWAADRLAGPVAELPETGSGLRGGVDPKAHPYEWSGPEPPAITPEWALHLAYTERFTRLSRMTVDELLGRGFRGEDLDLLIHLADEVGTPTAAAFAELCGVARRRIQEEEPERASSRDAVDESWYWAAPILLDLQADPDATRAWWSRDDVAAVWAGQEAAEDADSRWADHVERARSLLRGEITLGRKPDDLLSTLAQLAVAGWGTVAARALTRVTEGTGQDRVELRDAAGTVGWGLRSLFNLPEVTAMVRSSDPRIPYWRHILRYGAEGCLQAVLDEYAHVLVDDRGLFDSEPVKRWRVLAEAMREALTLRAARVRVDQIEAYGSRGIDLTRHNMRTHFAARFGDERQDDGRGAVRSSHLRTAFNSPFWPFVLASTSVGQEGLDFHLYSHAIVHWNLPSNPVDLEQREGRIHRFKNHAVRRNLARAHGDQLARYDASDPWNALFEHAVTRRPPGETDLVPYWVFPLAAGARIEWSSPAFVDT